MMVRTCSLQLLVVLLGGCIGINPAWDLAEGEATTAHDAASSFTDSGLTDASLTDAGLTASGFTTHDPSSGMPTTGADVVSGSSGTSGAIPGEAEPVGASSTGTSTGADDNTTTDDQPPCLEQGLTTCMGESGFYCADLYEDELNCGACSHRCADELENSRCDNGSCRCPGRGPTMACNGRCVNTNTDDRACGPGCVDCIAVHGPQSRCHGGSCSP